MNTAIVTLRVPIEVEGPNAIADTCWCLEILAQFQRDRSHIVRESFVEGVECGMTVIEHPFSNQTHAVSVQAFTTAQLILYLIGFDDVGAKFFSFDLSNLSAAERKRVRDSAHWLDFSEMEGMLA